MNTSKIKIIASIFTVFGASLLQVMALATAVNISPVNAEPVNPCAWSKTHPIHHAASRGCVNEAFFKQLN
jgi:hypothetical protein